MPALLERGEAAAETRLPPWETAIRLGMGLCVCLALAVVFVTCLMPIAVVDFWWQAKTGELIVHSGAIPTRDPFSWTANGQPWTVHEWLTEVFFYLLFTSLPNWVLLLYKCGLATLACALVLVRGWMRSGSLVLGIAAALAAGFVVRNYADLRPQMISFVLLAGLLLALDLYREGRLVRLPWVLPALFALWANLHGGVVVGLLLLFLWTAGEAAGQWLLRERSQGLGPLALGLAASGLAVALNPNGFLVYAYPFHVLGHPQVMDYITEWWAPNFHSPDMRAFELLLIGTLGVLAVARTSRYGEVVMLVAMAHAGLIAQRNTAPFGLAAAPALACGIAVLWGKAAPLQPLREWTRRPLFRGLGCGFLACGLGILLFILLPRAGSEPRAPLLPPGKWFEYAISLDFFPRRAVERMQQGEFPGRLYNDYVWGGYLIWKLSPERQVFIDGRAEVYYSTRTFDDEMTIHNVAPGWSEALDRRRVEVVLTSRSGYLAQMLRQAPAWQPVFEGDAEVVFVRRAEAPPAAR
jgi:hypothetical protein